MSRLAAAAAVTHSQQRRAFTRTRVATPPRATGRRAKPRTSPLWRRQPAVIYHRRDRRTPAISRAITGPMATDTDAALDRRLSRLAKNPPPPPAVLSWCPPHPLHPSSRPGRPGQARSGQPTACGACRQRTSTRTSGKQRTPCAALRQVCCACVTVGSRQSSRRRVPTTC